MRLILFTDGAARGNPGHAAIGIVVKNNSGQEVEALGKAIGITTNNEAEYQALLLGLKRALELGATELEIRTDSQLMAQQLQGRYKVRAANLKPLHKQAQQMLSQFGRMSILQIPRHLNRRADSLANAALDRSIIGGEGV